MLIEIEYYNYSTYETRTEVVDATPMREILGNDSFVIANVWEQAKGRCTNNERVFRIAVIG